MPRHIVIVEDEEAIAQNYCDALRRQGYKVTHYRTRPEATEAFAARLPDLAIIDVGLGEEIEGGFDLCRDLRIVTRLCHHMRLTIVGDMWA